MPVIKICENTQIVIEIVPVSAHVDVCLCLICMKYFKYMKIHTNSIYNHLDFLPWEYLVQIGIVSTIC